ncbi:MAG: hypothetical protein CL912_14990 [Deltaproteobacteria bacterium]|nr:hypothetical protein [Deltaproteobacteria bacterium]
MIDQALLDWLAEWQGSPFFPIRPRSLERMVQLLLLLDANAGSFRISIPPLDSYFRELPI